MITLIRNARIEFESLHFPVLKLFSKWARLADLSAGKKMILKLQN